MKFFKLSVFLIFFSFFQLAVHANDTETAILQQRTVTGTVVDDAGIPVPGATVVVTGTGVGTVTDTNGNYTINVPNNEAVLQFSFVGYLTVEQVVGNQTVISITMNEDTQQLDEVIVVGYGTMRKADLTGAVVRVNMDDKEMLANVTLSQALSAAAPGISVVSTSGRAGADPSLNIRGQNSFSSSQSPLIVLDGAIFYGSIADINVNDVATIDVLKDASSAAVYGSRSANGVIIITTKKGQEGKPRVSINSYYGWQWLTNTNRKFMDPETYAIRLTDFEWQQDVQAWYARGPKNESDLGGRPVRPDITDRAVVAANRYMRAEEPVNYLDNRPTDWAKKVRGEGVPIQQYNMSVSGRTDRVNYLFSAGYLKEEGVQKFDFSNRLNLRANVETKVTDWLTMGLNVTYSSRESAHDRVASIGEASEASPWADDDTHLPVNQRKMYLIGESYQVHPLAEEGWILDNVNEMFFYVANAKITVPWIQGLTYDIRFQRRTSTGQNNRFLPAWTNAGQGQNGEAQRRMSYGSD